MRAIAAPLLLALVACSPRTPPAAPPAPATEVAFTDAERTALLTLSPKPPLPPDPTNRVADDPCARELGRALFFDTRLSGNGEVACASCHVPALGFANAQPLGAGMGTTARHVPSLWNSAYNRWWFWDGRADSAWAQALGPMESGAEHGGSRAGIAHAIARDPALKAGYERVFGALPPLHDATRFPEHARPDPWVRWHPHALAWKGMTEEDRHAIDEVAANAAKAIAAYQRQLVGGDAPFDRFVRALRGEPGGDVRALGASAQRGARLFVGKGRCTTCHHGPLLSDLEFHDLRLEDATRQPRDTGRFRGIELVRRDAFNSQGEFADDAGASGSKLEYLVQRPENWGQFKTPSLRNVARTAPYMHDGRFATLKDVLRYYRTLEGAAPQTAHSEKTLQALDISDEEETDLLAFLESLDEELPPISGLVPPEAPSAGDCGRGH